MSGVKPLTFLLLVLSVTQQWIKGRWKYALQQGGTLHSQSKDYFTVE